MSPSTPVRSRFAPSPTGYLHIGSARTALFAWLHAKRHGGEFVLRIEDTDRERSTTEATQAIIDGMHWLGLDADVGPFFQTDRFSRYEEVLDALLMEGKAYRCYCTRERLDALREAQLAEKGKPRYDGHCRTCEPADINAPSVIRFKNPLDGEVSWEDQVCGVITIANGELDDLIIARTDGTPTYNFCVVVDDIDMGITEVIRGNDHINNTPRQINMFHALGATIPSFAHVPMILDEDGKKLSKRTGAANLLTYREAGFLPDALLNYLVRLGWSHGDQEYFTREEMIQLFDVNHINKSAARLNHEKLEWVNHKHMEAASTESMVPLLQAQFETLGIDIHNGPSLQDLLVVQVPRLKTLKAIADQSRYFYEAFDDYDEKAYKKAMKERAKDVLVAVKGGLASVADWTAEASHQVILDVAETMSMKLGKVAAPVRLALTGTNVSPGLDLTMALLGQEKTLARIDRLIALN